MTPTAPTSNVAEPPLHTFTRLLRQLHEFIHRDQRETDEAESVADEMDGLWHQLSRQERERARGLSEDLYALAEGGPKAIEMSLSEATAWQAEATRLRDALFLGRDPDVALAFLRRPHPRGMAPDAVPFLQGRCWERLGDVETALVFYREAARLNHKNADAVLSILQKLGRYTEAVEVSEVIIGAEDATPEELYLATSPLVALARGKSSEEAKPLLERAVDALGRARNLVDKGVAIAPPIDLGCRISLALATCLRNLGRPNEARQAVDNALRKAPQDPNLLAFRGYLRGMTDPDGAVRDFADAIRHGVASFWPYFFMSRHAIEQGNWREALAFAESAVQFPALALVFAEAYEVIAIAQSYLGWPPEVVLESFDRAVALSPTNERIRANREVARRKRGQSQSSTGVEFQLHNPEGEPWQFAFDGNRPHSAAERAFAEVGSLQ